MPLMTPAPFSPNGGKLEEDYTNALLLVQGGGVDIASGSEVTFINCNIYGNTATYVRAPLNLFHPPIMDKR